MSHAILVDLTACVGCGACRDACQQIHKFPENEEACLGAKCFTTLKTVENEDVGEVYIRQMCRHCQDPACASVCLVGALEKTKDGAVTWDANKCIGCRYCMLACPFDIPKYEWDSLSPKVRKCTMCYQERHITADMAVDKEGYVVNKRGERVTVDGREITAEERDTIVEMTTNYDDKRASACSVACPAEATIFGDRDELLAEARRRIVDNPDDYVPRVYGQKEVGGTSVFYISGVSFESLGFSTKVGDEALPQKTWNVLEKIPDIVVTAGVALGAVYWITNRRDDVKRYEDEVKKNRSKKSS
ncbi:4Fe-4S dicluster domain-containing protein [bacterium]|nr:4Fe-4S dicluster domain-containing protein [bacterium]